MHHFLIPLLAPNIQDFSMYKKGSFTICFICTSKWDTSHHNRLTHLNLIAYKPTNALRKAPTPSDCCRIEIVV